MTLSGSGTFFDHPADQKQALGDFRYERGKVVGYRLRDDGAQFLEVHATGQGNIIPGVSSPSDLGPAAASLYLALHKLGCELLGWLASYIGVPAAALLQCLDGPALEDVATGDCGACVLRLCNYALCETSVVFPEHTDASFLTLAPLGSAPGLQMWHGPSSSYVDVERGLDKQDLIVFVGDFVEVLTKGAYTAALHRVVLRPEDARERMSMPFLMRGKPDSEINTAPFVDSLGPDVSLLRVDALSYSDMRKFLDMKGRMRARRRLKEAAVSDAGTGK